MAVTKLTVNADAPYLSDVATDDLFGGNIILHRDAANPDSFQTGSESLGLTSLRYPGGTESEARFDLANPNATDQWYYQPPSGPDGQEPWTAETVPLSDFIDYCDDANMSMIFVMPTVRWAGTTRDASGNRQEAVDEDQVRSFVLDLLEETLDKGVPLDAIELGNEWWVDNADIWGENLSAVEYGRIASRLAVVIDTAVDDFVASHELPQDWERPDIVVQTGPALDMQFVTPTGEPIPDGYTGPVASSTELIFNEFNTDAEQAAVTGIVMHDYTSGSYDNINGFRYDEFDLWDELASADPDFVEAERYVTEWNVKNGNEDLSGLMQASAMVAMMAEMMRNGVDQAMAWPVQHGTTNSLTNNTGASDEPWLGLSAGGEALRMMSESLPGTRLMDVAGEPTNVDVTAFGGDNRVVLFIANETGKPVDMTFDVSQLVTGYSHVWGTLLGTASGDPLDYNLIPTITNLTAQDLVSGSLLEVELAPYELLRVEFTIAPTGVAMDGYTGDDKLVGSSSIDAIDGQLGNDSIWGRSGGDSIVGAGGSDWLYGESGADRLNGGDGTDRLYGGEDNDELKGDAGSDSISGNAGRDTLFGGESSDTLWGDDGNDLLRGGSGNDSLCGGAGLDSIYGEDGNDRVLAGSSNDALYGGAGSDYLDGADQNDTLFGDAGNDQLMGSSGTDRLYGQSDHDTLIGGKGDDRLFGGAGADSLDGGSGIDCADYSDATGAVLSDLQAPKSNQGDSQGDTYANIESLRGGDFSDQLWGNNGANTLWGRDGQDLLAGKGGNDVLVGGNGADTFEFRQDWDVDRIDDFADNMDTIVLAGFGVTSVEQALGKAIQNGSDVVFDFGGGDRLIVSDTTLAALQNDLMLT